MLDVLAGCELLLRATVEEITICISFIGRGSLILRLQKQPQLTASTKTPNNIRTAFILYWNCNLTSNFGYTGSVERLIRCIMVRKKLEVGAQSEEARIYIVCKISRTIKQMVRVEMQSDVKVRQ